MYDHDDSDEGRAAADGLSGFEGRYFDEARRAYEAGNREMAMHLFLAAYEETADRPASKEALSVRALRHAWDLALELRERSIAEFVFDKIEPFLDADEADEYAKRLQDLALDKLSEFGISRDELSEVADMISEEIGNPDSHTKTPAKVVSMKLPVKGSLDAASQKPSKQDHRRLMFSDLVGFDTAIEDTRALGIGLDGDSDMKSLIDTLRLQHGLDKLSAYGAIVFRTSSREDASYFMSAVVGELSLPAMRVQMQSGPQGIPVLAVSVTSDKPSRASLSKMAIEAPGVLVLEDIDMWAGQLMQSAATDDVNVVPASMTRAAREALTLIRAAVDNPDVYVLASVGGEADDRSFYYDMLEPMSIVDMYLPDEIDRRQIWDRVAVDHPSIRQLNLSALTRLSRNVSRCDIAMAAREAVEDAYKQSLAAHRYVPVTQSLMYEHLSNFQPLDSEEYRILENAVASSFSASLDADFDSLQSADDFEIPDSMPDSDQPSTGSSAAVSETATAGEAEGTDAARSADTTKEDHDGTQPPQ